MQMNVKYSIHGYKYENIVYIPVAFARYSWKYSTFIKTLIGNENLCHVCDCWLDHGELSADLAYTKYWKETDARDSISWQKDKIFQFKCVKSVREEAIKMGRLKSQGNDLNSEVTAHENITSVISVLYLTAPPKWLGF